MIYTYMMYTIYVYVYIPYISCRRSKWGHKYIYDISLYMVHCLLCPYYVRYICRRGKSGHNETSYSDMSRTINSLAMTGQVNTIHIRHIPHISHISHINHMRVIWVTYVKRIRVNMSLMSHIWSHMSHMSAYVESHMSHNLDLASHRITYAYMSHTLDLSFTHYTYRIAYAYRIDITYACRIEYYMYCITYLEYYMHSITYLYSILSCI